MDLCGYLDIGHVDIQMWTQWCGNRCKFGEMYNTNWMWYLDVVIGCGGFSGIWKEKSASRKVRWQQLERQGGRKDGSVWSFPACLCKTFCILLLYLYLYLYQV